MMTNNKGLHESLKIANFAWMVASLFVDVRTFFRMNFVFRTEAFFSDYFIGHLKVANFAGMVFLLLVNIKCVAPTLA